jgi:hypothetical protein
MGEPPASPIGTGLHAHDALITSVFIAAAEDATQNGSAEPF